jgi:hypothetical protein
MIKKLFVSLLLLASSLVAAPAADPEVSNGKVVAIEGNSVKIEVVGDVAAWIKKGAYVRAVSDKGATILRGAKVTNTEDKVITVQTSMAKELKVGGTYKLSKGKPSAGC